MSNILLKSLLILALCFLVSCSTGTKKTKDAEPKFEDQALAIAKAKHGPDSKAYQKMDSDYRNKQYKLVLDDSKKFIKQYPSSALLELVYHLRSLSSIGLKQYPNAISQLKRTLEIARSRPNINENLVTITTYNLAYVHFEMGQTDQANFYLQEINPNSLDANNRARYYMLKAKIARMNQDFTLSGQNILLAIQNYQPDKKTALKPLFTFLDEILEHIDNPVTIEKWISDFSETSAGDRLYYKSAMMYQKQGDKSNANALFEKIVTLFPESQYVGIAKDNLKVVEHSAALDSAKIGVLLTLSGKYAKFGYKTLQGIELAFKIFNNRSGGTDNTSLIVMDDQGEPSVAAQKMEELFYKHNVVAVIGPMSSKVVEAAGNKANELGLPLVTLSQKEFPNQNGTSYVLNAGLTASLQVQSLIKYATEKLNIKRFGMLAPATKFGDEYTKLFWDEIDKRGAQVRGFETYPNEETDFRIYVDKMVGLSAQDARSKEIEEMKALKAAIPIKKKTKKFDRLFDLRPIVDFDAVFVPDDPKVLGQLIPTFAYRDVDNMLFLGTNTWNSTELISRAGKFAEGSIFVDGFFANSKNPKIQAFIQDYQATFASDPTVMEAVAYDAAKIVQGIITVNSISSRSEFKDYMNKVKDFAGLSGPIQSQNGTLQKTLHLLTLKSGKIEEIVF